MRTLDFPVKSPQAVCSPPGTEETVKSTLPQLPINSSFWRSSITSVRFIHAHFFHKCICVLADSRPPLIVKTRSVDVPTGGAPDLLTSADRRKKKQKGRCKEENEEMENNTLYGIVSTPSKDSARLTLKLTRVKSSDTDQPGEFPPQAHVNSNQESDLVNASNQLSRTAQDVSHEPVVEEQENCQQAPVFPNTKEAGAVSSIVFEDAEMDTIAEIERIERESASDRERWSKEVQDKGIVLPCVTMPVFNFLVCL